MLLLFQVAGSLSTGLHTVAMDQQHIEERGRIMENHSGSGKDHLIAGIRGLGHGILGGMTSIFSQTYEGVRQDGLEVSTNCILLLYFFIYFFFTVFVLFAFYQVGMAANGFRGQFQGLVKTLLPCF